VYFTSLALCIVDTTRMYNYTYYLCDEENDS